MADVLLDCKGLKCPMPIVKINMASKTLHSGGILEVEADDLAFKPDLEAWIHKVGYELLSFEELPHYRARIRKP